GDYPLGQVSLISKILELRQKPPDQPSLARLRLGVVLVRPPACVPALFLGSLGLECLWDSKPSPRFSITRDTFVSPLPVPSAQFRGELCLGDRSHRHCAGHCRHFQQLFVLMASAHARNWAEGLLANLRLWPILSVAELISAACGRPD